MCKQIKKFIKEGKCADDQTKLYALLSGLKPQLATFAEVIEAARIQQCVNYNQTQINI